MFWLNRHLKYFLGFLISLNESLGCNLDGGLLDDDGGGGCCNGSEKVKENELSSASFFREVADSSLSLSLSSALVGSTATQPPGDPGWSGGLTRV